MLALLLLVQFESLKEQAKGGIENLSHTITVGNLARIAVEVHPESNGQNQKHCA